MGGMCVEPNNCNKKKDKCNPCYLIKKCDIQFHVYTSNTGCHIECNKYVAFNYKAFCEYIAFDCNGCEYSTTHYFFLGTKCNCNSNELVYDCNKVYYLHNDNGIYYLREYFCNGNKNNRISKEKWNECNNPGTWDNIYMICADSEHIGQP